MLLLFIFLFTSTTSIFTAAAPQLTVNYSPLFRKSLRARRESIDSQDENSNNVDQPLLLATEVYLPAKTPLHYSSDFKEESVGDPEMGSTLKKFMALRKQAQKYEGRELKEEDLLFFSDDFLQRVLKNPDQSIAIATLEATLPLFQRIISRERNSDIDYIARNLKELFTLDAVKLAAVIQAERNRDLNTLEEMQRAHAIAVFRPTASPSKPCLRKPIKAIMPDDSGTETSPTIDKQKRKGISFSPDSLDMIDLSSPTEKIAPAKGSLHLLFGDDQAK